MASVTPQKSWISRCCRSCFPNGCCGYCKPPIKIQQKVDTHIHVDRLVKEKEKPYGYINIYPGVRTMDNSYTSPMLAVHLYQQSESSTGANLQQSTLAVSGTRQATVIGPQVLKRQATTNDEEEVIMIPVEDVTIIGSKAEVKKGVQADIESNTEPKYEVIKTWCDYRSDKLSNCCSKIYDSCCCCCSTPKVTPFVENTVITAEDPNRRMNYEEEFIPVPEKEVNCCTRKCYKLRCWCCQRIVLTGHTKRTKTVSQRNAQRVVTISLEYSKYSHLDSASNARLLSQQDQLTYYKQEFDPHTKIQFYLINDTEYIEENFNLKRQQAETLCRTIMQLKAMRNNYPSDDELMKILDQPHRRTFGDEFRETQLQLTSNSTIQALRAPPIDDIFKTNSRPAILEREITTASSDRKPNAPIVEEANEDDDQL